MIDEKRKNLIAMRRKAKMTQKELAALIGLTERQYQNIEAGISDSSIKVWQHLKELLGAKSIDFLLEQEVIKKKETAKWYD